MDQLPGFPGNFPRTVFDKFNFDLQMLVLEPPLAGGSPETFSGRTKLVGATAPNTFMRAWYIFICITYLLIM